MKPKDIIMSNAFEGISAGRPGTYFLYIKLHLS
jgi:hypothetical protein